MDLKICGILDIVIIIVGIIVAIVGYKKGFMKKMLSLIGIVGIVIFSWSFCGQFAQILKYNNIIYPDIFSSVQGNILANVSESFGPDITTAKLVSYALGVPEFLGGIIANGMSLPETGDLILAVAEYVTMFAMNAISFGILLASLLLLFGIAALLIHILKKNKFIKVVDGILGIFLYLAIYFIILSLLFFILSLIINQEWFSSVKDWLNVDMMLEDDSAFRLSKALYEGNVITRVISFLFGNIN